MQFRKKAGVVDLPLEDRIRGLQVELEDFVRSRALEVQKGTGLPLENVIMMLRGHTASCQCATALRVISDRRRDAEIAEREAIAERQKESAA
jgi:hypothetical protein